MLLVGCGDGLASGAAPRIVCHNANCGATALDFDADDSLPSLAASLELGPTMIDGVELDFSWDQGRCIFGHGGDKPSADPDLAVAMVEDYLANVGGRTPSGEPFIAYLEMKRTDDLRLVDCVARVGRSLVGTEVFISSGSPELLMAARERVAPGEAQLMAEGPAALVAEPDLVSVSVIQTKDDALQRYDALGIDVALWADLDLPSVFGELRTLHPRFISVPNVAAVRSFLAR